MSSIVECKLCPRHCRLKEGDRSDCRVRINLDGKLHTLVYGNPCSVHVDPIEKKPLYHVLPGSGSFSIATAGCNLHCKYCQNWQISQSPPEDLKNYDMPPEKVVEAALKANCRSIAYTYSDPIIFYEYMYDTSIIAHQNKLLNVMVTAGYIEQKPLLELCPLIDAAHVDLKGMSDEFYNKMSRGTLAPVLNCIKTMRTQGVWVEIINLIVPTWNDSKDDITKLCKWILDNVGADVPLHFSRFWPTHQLTNLPPTPLETMEMAWNIGKDIGLNYVYLGNVPDHEGNNTYCPKDKTLLISRRGYRTVTENFVNGTCKTCGTKIPGIW